jgi:hypothetical protein
LNALPSASGLQPETAARAALAHLVSERQVSDSALALLIDPWVLGLPTVAVFHGDERPPRVEAVRTPDGTMVLVEHRCAREISGLIDKLEYNARSLPLLKRFGGSAANAEPAAQATIPLAPVGKSRPLLRFGVDVVALLVRVSKRSGGAKSSGVSLRYLTDAELDLLGQLCAGVLLQHETATTSALKERLDTCRAALQLLLTHSIYLFRRLEDIDGMSGTALPAAVLASARTAYLELLRANFAARGCPVFDEATLLELARRESGPLYAEALRGTFPTQERASLHFDWLNALCVQRIAEWSQHAIFRLTVHLASRWNPSNRSATGAESRKSEDESGGKDANAREYVERSLRNFGATVADLVSRPPGIKGDDTVCLTGSLPEGNAHPRSDIDLIVLTAELPVISQPRMEAAPGHMECHCGHTPGGHKITAEYFDHSCLRRLVDWLERKHQLLSGADTEEDLFTREYQLRAVLTDPEARLIYRAGLSFPLKEDGAGKQWRGSLRVDRFTELMTSAHLSRFWSWLTRADALSGSSGDAATIVRLRTAFEHLVLAHLASRGQFLWSRRWILVAVSRCYDRNMLDATVGAFFPVAGNFRMYRAELLSRYHELATDMQARGTLPGFGAML